jgi:hypothetical protein
VKETLAKMIDYHGLPAVLRFMADAVKDMETRINDDDYVAECRKRVTLLNLLADSVSGE